MQVGALLQERRKDLLKGGHTFYALAGGKPRGLIQELERLAVPDNRFVKLRVLLLLLGLHLALCVRSIRDVLDEGRRTASTWSIQPLPKVLSA